MPPPPLPGPCGFPHHGWGRGRPISRAITRSARVAAGILLPGAVRSGGGAQVPGSSTRRARPARTVGAVIARDGSVDAGVITSDGGRSGVSAAASAQLAAIAPEPEAADRRTRRPRPLSADRAARPARRADHRDGSADRCRRRHAAVGARHVLRGRRRRADRRDDRGHPDHPSPTRPAVKGFRGGPRRRRPRARQGRGAVCRLRSCASTRQARTPRSASSVPR